jgi:RNA-directed DNA polymerase
MTEQYKEERLSRGQQEKLVTALRVARMKCETKGLDGEVWRDMLYDANLGLVPERLGQMRNLLKSVVGYDPLEEDTRPKGEKQPGLARSEAKQQPSLQDLRRKIYDKAKAEEAWRFWGLYVHVTKLETLREAYRLAKKNNGAPGIDGVSFEAIEEGGVEGFLEGIRDELTSRKYRPMRNRIKEIPKGEGKVRVLGIPAIRDRVVQGALKLILEPIFEADFQPGSFGYRPKRTAHEAIKRVDKAIFGGKTRVIDVDLKAFFDNVRHHILMEKVARRVKDGEILRLLKLMLKATGKKGVPQGGVISPLLSNIYLNEVDKMLERAKETTRQGGSESVEYARYADDLVILVGPHPRQDWLLEALGKRLREEFTKLQVEVNEEKTKNVDLGKDESFGFLGFEFRRVRTRRGTWRPYYAPKLKKRTELIAKLKEIFWRYRSQPITRVVDLINPILRGWVQYFRVGDSRRCFSYLQNWLRIKVRRHLRRNQGRRGMGWKQWSNEWLDRNLGLYNDFQIRRYQPGAKATTSP